MDDINPFPVLHYRISTMQRFGHHAIMHWIASGHTGMVKCTGFGLDRMYKKDKNNHFDSANIVSFENRLMPPMNEPNVLNIVVLRDPFNWLASVLHCDRRVDKKSNLGIKANQQAMDMYEQFLRRGVWSGNYIDINYNKWFSDYRYRKWKAQVIKTGAPNAGKQDVHYAGGGSSFDGCKFHGRAEQMDVLNRWRIYERDVQYLTLLAKNYQLLKLANMYFSFFPFELRQRLERVTKNLRRR